jgi:hypothetical protein
MPAALMYPAAVCPPPSPGRFDARHATARRLRRPSAPNAARLFPRRLDRGPAASIARSCKTGSASIVRAMPPSGAVRRWGRVRPRALPTSRSGPNRRTTWCSRLLGSRRRPRHMSTTPRQASTTGRLRRLRLRPPSRPPPRGRPPPHRRASSEGHLRPFPLRSRHQSRRHRPRSSHRLRGCSLRSSHTTLAKCMTTAIGRRTTIGGDGPPA